MQSAFRRYFAVAAMLLAGCTSPPVYVTVVVEERGQPPQPVQASPLTMPLCLLSACAEDSSCEEQSAKHIAQRLKNLTKYSAVRTVSGAKSVGFTAELDIPKASVAKTKAEWATIGCYAPTTDTGAHADTRLKRCVEHMPRWVGLVQSDGRPGLTGDSEYRLVCLGQFE
jgi:hypothetical protein